MALVTVRFLGLLHHRGSVGSRVQLDQVVLADSEVAGVLVLAGMAPVTCKGAAYWILVWGFGIHLLSRESRTISVFQHATL